MSSSLTNGVNYSLKPTSVKCSRKQLVIPSSNKLNFAPGETCVLYLPSLKNHVIDGQSGYLRFQATITGDGFLDVSAHSLIERIVTYGSGGQVISDLNCYRSIATALLDLQLSQSEKVGLSPALGCEDVYTTLTFVNTNIANAQKPTVAELEERMPNANRRGKKLTNGETYSFAIPVLHPLFTMSEKMWPSFAMADDTRIEITWSTASNALVTSTNFEIKNPEICVDALEFDSTVFPMIQQTYAGRDLIIPAQDYKYYASQIAAGTSGNISQIIPAKQQSARAMFFRFRPADTQADGYSTGSSVNPFYTQGDNFSLVIGGVRHPQKPITTQVTGQFAPWWASTMTALHSFNSTEMDGNINQTYYEKYSLQGKYSGTTNSFQNAFCLGVNLDSLRGANQTTNSGMNLSSVTSYYEAYLAAAPTQVGAATTQSVSVDTYVLHDVLFIVGSDGNVSLRM